MKFCAVSYSMMMMVMLLLLSTLVSAEDSEDCAKYDNCIQCTGTVLNGKNHVKCQWSITEGKCIPNTAALSIGLSNWDLTFSACVNEPQSILLTNQYNHNQYLSHTSTKSLPDTIELIHSSETNLYCPSNFYSAWHRQLEPGPTYSFYTILTNPNDKLLFVLQNEDGSIHRIPYDINNNSHKLLFEKLTSFSLHYYTMTAKTNDPFVLTISYEYNISKTITIVIAITIGMMFILAINIFIIIYSIRRRAQSIYVINQREEAYNNRFQLRRGGSIMLSHIQFNIDEPSKKTIENFNLSPIKYTDELNEYGTNCTICLEDYKVNEEVIVLTCKHIFHYTCLKGYLEKLLNDKKVYKSRCPNCNIEMKVKEIDNGSIKSKGKDKEGNALHHYSYLSVNVQQNTLNRLECIDNGNVDRQTALTGRCEHDNEGDDHIVIAPTSRTPITTMITRNMNINDNNTQGDSGLTMNIQSNN